MTQKPTVRVKKLKTEITKSDLKNLQKSLKKMDKTWVEKLVKKIQADEAGTDYEEVTDQKIYNIFNSRVANGSWKLIVYKYAKALLAEMEAAALLIIEA